MCFAWERDAAADGVLRLSLVGSAATQFSWCSKLEHGFNTEGTEGHSRNTENEFGRKSHQDYGRIIATKSTPGENMTTTTTTTTPAATAITASPKMQAIGQYVQFAGAAAFIVGTVLSLHHYAYRAFVLSAGAAAFFIGKKMRGAVMK